MSIKQDLELYQSSMERVMNYFDDLTGHWPPDLHLKYYWYYCDRRNSIQFQDEIFTPEDLLLDDFEIKYGYDIRGTGVWIKEEYSLFYVDNGCGDKFLALFDNSKRVINE
jgi:hypothetical protein